MDNQTPQVSAELIAEAHRLVKLDGLTRLIVQGMVTHLDGTPEPYIVTVAGYVPDLDGRMLLRINPELKEPTT